MDGSVPLPDSRLEILGEHTRPRLLLVLPEVFWLAPSCQSVWIPGKSKWAHPIPEGEEGEQKGTPEALLCCPAPPLLILTLALGIAPSCLMHDL